jgi:hypothetical protein
MLSKRVVTLLIVILSAAKDLKTLDSSLTLRMTDT